MPHQRAQQQQQSVAGIAQTGGWQLDVDQGFKAGRSADESDEEGEGVPQSLPGAAGSDDEEEREYERNASAAFCRAFEREAEEDEFDTMAVEGMGMRAPSGAAAAMPALSTEVLDDNPFDRLTSLRRPQAQETAAGTGADAGVGAAPAAPPSAKRHHGGGDGGGGGLDAMEADGEGQEGYARQRPQLPEINAAGPSGRALETAALEPAPARGGRRVTFDLPSPISNGGGGGRGPDAGGGRGGVARGDHSGGGGGGGRRGRGGRRVPDHVAHPEKYTVYVLDEPVFVGQGDKGRGGREDADNERAARSAQQAAAASDGPSEHDPERFRGDFGAGGFKFQPSAKRQRSGKPEGGGDGNAAGAAAAAAAVAASRGAYAEEDPAEAQAEVTILGAAANGSAAMTRPVATAAAGQAGQAVPSAMEVDENGSGDGAQETVADGGSGALAVAAAGGKGGRRRNYRTAKAASGGE